MVLELAGFLNPKMVLLQESGNAMDSNRESSWEHTARLLFTALLETQDFFVMGDRITDPKDLVEAVKKGRPIMSVNKKI